MNVRRANTDVRWVGFHPLRKIKKSISQLPRTQILKYCNIPYLVRQVSELKRIVIVQVNYTHGDEARVRLLQDEEERVGIRDAANIPSYVGQSEALQYQMTRLVPMSQTSSLSRMVGQNKLERLSLESFFATIIWVSFISMG
jgi:hypothetical protein